MGIARRLVGCPKNSLLPKQSICAAQQPTACVCTHTSLRIIAMNEVLNQMILDNSLRSYLISAGIILGVAIFRRLLSKGAAWLIAKMITNKNRPFDRKRFHDLVLAPLDLFILVLAFIIAMHRLTMPALLKFTIYKAPFHDIIEAIGRGVLIGSFVWLCNRMIIYVSHLLQQKAALTADR